MVVHRTFPLGLVIVSDMMHMIEARNHPLSVTDSSKRSTDVEELQKLTEEEYGHLLVAFIVLVFFSGFPSSYLKRTDVGLHTFRLPGLAM